MESAREIELATVKAKLDLLEVENKKRDASSAQQKNWISTITQSLLVPAAILALVLQFTEVGSGVANTEKAGAETEKIRVETLKARAELEKQLDELASAKSDGIKSYRKQVELIVPKLQQASESLKELQKSSDQNLITKLFAKYIIIVFIFHIIGLTFDIFAQIWNYIVTTGHVFVNRQINKINENLSDSQIKKRTARRYFMIYGITIASSLPNILRWSISLAVFIALFIPLFDETALALGSSVTFYDLWVDASAFRISKAINTLRDMLFP